MLTAPVAFGFVEMPPPVDLRGFFVVAVGATVVGGTVVGATVVGASVVGATVVGACVVGVVVGAAVVGGAVVATVVGAVDGTRSGGTVPSLCAAAGRTVAALINKPAIAAEPKRRRDADDEVTSGLDVPSRNAV